MLPIELKEFLHNIKDHDFDMCGQYKIDKNEADKVIKQLERLDNIFVNADEIEPDDEIFNDGYSDKNTQNGWIYCKDRLPEDNKINPITQDYYEYVCVFKNDDIYDVRNYKYGRGHWWNMGGIMDDYVIAWQPLPEWEE